MITSYIYVYNVVYANKVVDDRFISNGIFSYTKAHVIGTRNDISELHFCRNKPISIEDHLMTTVSLTHLVSLCYRQCPTARVDQHRWTKLPRDTFVTHLLVHTQIYYCSNMSDFVKSYYQLVQSAMWRFSSLSVHFFLPDMNSFCFSQRKEHMSDRSRDETGKLIDFDVNAQVVSALIDDSNRKFVIIEG